MLIQSLIAGKHRFNDGSMLPDRDHRQLFHIEIHCHRDQVGVLLALDNFRRRDVFRLGEMNGRDLLAHHQFWAFRFPSGFAAALLKIAVVARGIVDPDPLGALIDLQAHKALSQIAPPKFQLEGSRVQGRMTVSYTHLTLPTILRV